MRNSAHEIQPLLSHICMTKTSDPYFKRIVLQNLIALLSAMQEELTPSRESAFRRDNEAVKNCMLYINQHFCERISLEDLAVQLHIHPNYLCTLFKEHTGQTVFQYLHRILMEHAAKLNAKTESVDLPNYNRMRIRRQQFFLQKIQGIHGNPTKKVQLPVKNALRKQRVNFF